MKSLRFILASIYVALIVLLLLMGKSCQGQAQKPDEPVDSVAVTPVDTIVDTPLTDTVSVIEEAEKIGGKGDLKVTLMWNFEGDIDLHVNQPNGVEIDFRHKVDNETGGFLDFDNMNGGHGSIENIYWENPPEGRYEVELVYYKQMPWITSAGECTVVVFKKGGDPEYYRVVMSRQGEHKAITTININNY